MNTIVLNNKDTYRFSLAACSTLVAFGVTIACLFHLLGLLLLLPVPFILTIRQGVELDLPAMQYRKFKSFLGKRKGDWKALNPSCDLVILSKTGRHINNNRTGYYDETKKFFELYLMDESHRNRMFLYSSGDKEDVVQMAQTIAQQSPFEIRVFNPESRRTR
jgi:hypothetical protein